MSNSWKRVDDSLVMDLEFEDFMEVVDFVNQVAELAEKHGHHPDLRIYDYKMLEITLTTHDEGGVTDKDYALAEEIEGLLE